MFLTDIFSSRRKRHQCGCGNDLELNVTGSQISLAAGSAHQCTCGTPHESNQDLSATLAATKFVPTSGDRHEHHQNLVCIKGLSVRLGPNQILQDINLDVPTGQTLALCGANGSGKSTLVRTLVGLNPITQGSIELFGVDLSAPKRLWPLEKVGYVPQRLGNPSTVPATALEVVQTGLLSRGQWLLPTRAKSKALAALEQVGMAFKAKERFQYLSGGQQQRVLIARALIRNPKLLIMDEPLAGVDQDSQLELAKTIGQLRQQGVTMILVVHGPGCLRPHIDRVIYLAQGRVAYEEKGTAQCFSTGTPGQK